MANRTANTRTTDGATDPTPAAAAPELTPEQMAVAAANSGGSTNLIPMAPAADPSPATDPLAHAQAVKVGDAIPLSDEAKAILRGDQQHGSIYPDDGNHYALDMKSGMLVRIADPADADK
jgi:hypothetical protein